MEQLDILKVQGKLHEAKAEPWAALLEGIQDELSLDGHFDARTLDEAGHLLRSHEHKRAKVIAGGTDLLRLIKRQSLPVSPEVLVNIKSVPGLSGVREENGVLKIGALARLSDIESSELVRARCAILADTVARIASPQVRNMATIAGSICQDVHCWYYRATKNYFNCARKGGTDCPAVKGDNRWMFSIFETQDCDCHAACQSDMAVALYALGASVKTTQRTIPIEQFFSTTAPGHVLKQDEVITEIQLPALESGDRAKYLKFSVRNAIDHPLVSAGYVARGGKVRLALGGVHILPYSLNEAAELVDGKAMTGELAQKAGDAAVAKASPMSMNAWKVQVARTLVKRALLSTA